jgi:hypothetical protein
MNPVMALRMKQNAVLSTSGTTQHARNAVVQAPSCLPGDPCIADRAETALFVPEKAKKTGAPKRILHMIRFTFLEVSFIDRIVGVRVASNLDMSSDGNATGQE